MYPEKSLSNKIIAFQNASEQQFKVQKSLPNFLMLFLAYASFFLSTFLAAFRLPFLWIRSLLTVPKQEKTKSVQLINRQNIIPILQENEWVVVKFSAIWCGPCMMMETVLEDFAQQNTHLHIGKIDADRDSDLLRDFNVKGLPQILLFHRGKEIKRHVGALSSQELYQFTQLEKKVV